MPAMAEKLKKLRIGIMLGPENDKQKVLFI
jgi:hypothetical protein